MGVTQHLLKRDVSVGTMDGLITNRHFRAGSTAGQNINKTTAMTIPAVSAAISFRADAVALPDLGVYRNSSSPLPERVMGSWQSRLLRGVPNPQQDFFRFKEVIEASITARGNAYVWKTKDAETGRVTALTALHPDQVFPYLYQVRGNELMYPVMFSPWYPSPPECDGYGTVTVDAGTIWHIRGRGSLGEVVAPSPVARFAQSLGVALAEQDYQANFYEQGMLGALGVTFPAGTTKAQADEWSDAFQGGHAGTTNTGRPIVVGGGATIAPIGVTPRDAQFLESIGATTLDISNIFGVPEWFLGAGTKAEKAVSPEHEEMRWVHHYLEPELRRIEQSMYADPDLFGPGSDLYPMFDTSGLIHPDSATKATILKEKVQSGQWTPDEARAADGMPPLPNEVGANPVYIPVGGTPFGTPDPTAKPPAE